MTEIISKLGLSGGVGLIVGFILVWWVEPDTHQGIGLLIGVTTLLAIVIGELISKTLKALDPGESRSRDDLE